MKNIFLLTAFSFSLLFAGCGNSSQPKAIEGQNDSLPDSSVRDHTNAVIEDTPPAKLPHK